jgi:hypothetical protein
MSTGPIDTSVDAPKDVNGRSIWPNWANQQEWQNKLHEQAVRKALDIPSDDMQIVQNKTGIGTAGAVGIAAAAGIPSALTAGALALSLMGGGSEAPQAPEPPAISDSEYQVLFYDKDGNPIVVPHISQKDAAQ